MLILQITLFACLMVVSSTSVTYNNKYVTDEFCKLTCEGKENVACKCKRAPGCRPAVINPLNLLKFRERMVHKHNVLREKVASGTKPHKVLGKASNMNIINYDLSLERSALCHALSCSVSDDSDRICGRTKYYPHVHQNVYTNTNCSSLGNKVLNYARRAINTWYNGYNFITPEMIGNYVEVPGMQNQARIREFAVMMKDVMTTIGCAVAVYAEDGSLKVVKIVCHYGGSGNFSSKPVYKTGKPCTKCQFDRSCDDEQYPSLCGCRVELPFPQD